MFNQLLFVYLFMLRNSSYLKPELLIMTQAENKFNWRNGAIKLHKQGIVVGPVAE